MVYRKNMVNPNKKQINLQIHETIVVEGKDDESAVKKAVNVALLHHKAVGNKVAFLKNGKIVHEIPSNAKMG